LAVPDRYGQAAEDADWNGDSPPPWTRRDPDAIAECPWCDDDGLRRNGQQCDHVDYGEIAKRGMAQVRAALERKPR